MHHPTTLDAGRQIAKHASGSLTSGRPLPRRLTRCRSVRRSPQSSTRSATRPAGRRRRGLPDLPALPEGADLAARIAAYKAALPAPENIGKTTVTRHMFDQPTLADLEACRVPAVNPAVVGIPDKAADGGPGATAMRHLDIVKAAGKDLHAELQARITAKLGLTPERQAKSDAAAARIKEIRRRRIEIGSEAWRIEREARDGFAKQHGYSSYAQLQFRAQRSGDPALVGPRA